MDNQEIDTVIDGIHLKIHSSESAGDFIGIHFHPYFEIHFIIAGSYKITADDAGEDQEIWANAKDVIIVPPETRHSVTSVDNTELDGRASFWVDIEKLPKKNRESFVLKAFSAVRDITVMNETADLTEMITDIKLEMQNKKSGYVEYVRNAINNIIILLCRNLNGVYDKTFSEEYNKKSIAISIKEYINANYGGECTLKNMAEELYISEKHLNQLMHKFYSQSFTQLLFETRMSMANYFIKENEDMPLREIAEKTGYSSVSAFYHAYNRFFNMTPNEYRQKHKRERTE